MLTVKNIRFKNFMSYGAAWNEVDLVKDQLSVISARNGGGKTSIIVALSFALYNKAFNGAPKSKLVNSINGKQMVVEVEFDSNGIEYKVIRGIKPSVFQIYKDDKLINEDSNSRDYQSVLEDQILRMNYKTFVQTVIVGTASYTPFMELNSAERRIVVEDLLGVGILTTMGLVLKQKSQTNTNSINDNAYTLKTIKIQLESDKAVIDTLKQARQNNIDNLQKQKQTLYKQIDEHNKKIDKFNKAIEKLVPAIEKYDQFKQALAQLQQQHNEVVTLINGVLSQQKFVNNNDECPTCHQKIEQKYRDAIIERTEKQRSQHQEKLDKIQAKLDSLYQKQQKFIDLINKSNQLNNDVRVQNNSISLINRQIADIDRQIEQPDNSDQIEEKRAEIEGKVLQAKDLIEQKIKLINEKNIIDQCGNLLKDAGIKSAVVGQYLPIINQMINKYLADMDFYLSFELDAQFNETIRARGRDDMTYQNLSQGERRRLDLAIMFTWRYIAQIRNSCGCSNIFIDEILDSSLDQAGIEAVMKLFRSFTDSNIIVISHRENVQEMEFDNIITIEKRNQFSVLNQ